MIADAPKVTIKNYKILCRKIHELYSRKGPIKRSELIAVMATYEPSKWLNLGHILKKVYCEKISKALSKPTVLWKIKKQETM
jgi:hypothetical protein